MYLYLEAFWGILVEIAPFVLLGMLAAGLVHESLGRFHRLRAFAMERNWLSLSFFNFAGFSLPICSCGVVPLAVGLRRQGVPLGNIFTFVFSGPATSIAAVILSMAVLGLDFTLYYVSGAILCGYLLGVLFFLLERNPTPGLLGENVHLCDSSSHHSDTGGFFLRAIRWGTVTYGSRIAFDLILGLALAALLVSAYPLQTLSGWVGDLPFWQAAMLMLAIAVPLYICSLPGILVGGTLVLGGISPALVWIFLMAGPVTNLGDINVLRRNLGWHSTFLYVGAVVLLTFLWGWVIHINFDWVETWAHVREYYARQVSALDFEGEMVHAITDVRWLGIPREFHYASGLIMVFLTLNGAWLHLKELWRNPCVQCKHFQNDLCLYPAICRRPCWKRRIVRLAKRHKIAMPQTADHRQSSLR